MNYKLLWELEKEEHKATMSRYADTIRQAKVLKAKLEDLTRRPEVPVEIPEMAETIDLSALSNKSYYA